MPKLSNAQRKARDAAYAREYRKTHSPYKQKTVPLKAALVALVKFKYTAPGTRRVFFELLKRVHYENYCPNASETEIILGEFYRCELEVDPIKEPEEHKVGRVPLGKREKPDHYAGKKCKDVGYSFIPERFVHPSRPPGRKSLVEESIEDL
jgi:hypothetical protein